MARVSAKPSLQEALEKTGFSKEKLEKGIALSEERNRTLEDVLLVEKLATVDEICTRLTQYYNTPYIPLPGNLNSAAHLVPRSLVVKHKVIPISLEGRGITLGMINPRDVEAQDDVSFLTGYEVNPIGILEFQFDEYLEGQVAHKAEALNLKDVIRDVSSGQRDGIDKGMTVLENSESAVQKFIRTMVADAITHRVSDIHIEPQETILLLRYRIDGLLRTAYRIPNSSQNQIISALKIMASLDITETRKPQDGRLTIKINGRNVDMRIATILTNFGENIVIRLLDTKNIKFGMNDLGIPDYVQARLKELGMQNTGMLLVTGPTGSGKTTTLYAFLQTIRSPTLKIITLEDPIEYPILEGDKQQEGGITQIQVNPKISMTFAMGLRAALRLDPDIMFVGEIRDLETAEIAFSAALTGRLVLSTLHTNDAPSTITRLLDMDVHPFLISGALQAVLSQRLVRRLCSECRVRYEPPGRTMERLAKSLPREVVLSLVPTLYRPQGCKACGGRGYSGRIGLYELLEVNDEMRAMILNKTPILDMMNAAKSTGLRSLRTAGLIEVLKGRTTLAEVFRVTPKDT
ncbi:MAG: type II/IV secretion system protein [Elusimicrobia bacterium]|nr:type II/IV secretion system protein [Elusimicrobiota bacterium]